MSNPSIFPEGPVPRNTDRAEIALTKLLEIFLNAIDGSGALKVSGAGLYFKDLADVPRSYEGKGGHVVTVRNDETGVEFVIPTVAWGNLLGDITAQTDLTDRINALADALVAWGNISGDITEQTDLITKITTMINAALISVIKTKGGIDCSSNPNYPAATAQDLYYITVAGKIGGASGIDVSIGDTLICLADSVSGDQAAVGANWLILNTNIPGLSTLGILFATLANPAGERYLRINADGSITQQTAAELATATGVDGKAPANLVGSPFPPIQVAASDEATAITAGTAKTTFRTTFAGTVTAIRASLTTAQASGTIFTVNVKKNGVTFFSTKITIDNTEKTSVTAVTAPVLSITTFADDDEITVDVDQIGDGTAKGLKVSIIGTYA